jgi:hypothetical protein
MMKIRNRILIIPVFQLSIAIFFSLGCNSMSIFGSEEKKANDTGSVIAVDDSFDIEAGTTVEIPINNLIANDVTGNKPPLTVTSVFDAIGGTVTLGVDSVTFTSTGEADEPASFMYTIDNAAGKSADGFVRLTVTRAAQSRLIASNDTWSVYAGKSTTIPGANLTANDIDQTEKPPLTIAEVKNANGGTVTLNQSTGIITFTSTGNPGAGASFVYIVQNADGLTAEATVTITVEEAPSVIANADTFDLIQGQETYIQASALMQNDEGDGNISLVGISDPVGGTVVRTGDTITFVSTGYAYNPAGFSYTIEDELGTTATGSVFINITPLAPIEAYIYDSTDQMAAMRDSYVPPTIQDIFNTWGRFNGNNYYANKAAADAAGDNNAKAWQFLIEPDRVSMPLNVDPYNGFVSNESLENYTLEATFASNDTDNDTIGLVIAFVREGSTNYILSALRTQGGTEPISGWGVTYGTGVSGAKYNQVEWIVAEKNVGGFLPFEEALLCFEHSSRLIKRYGERSAGDPCLKAHWDIPWMDFKNKDAVKSVELGYLCGQGEAGACLVIEAWTEKKRKRRVVPLSAPAKVVRTRIKVRGRRVKLRLSNYADAGDGLDAVPPAELTLLSGIQIAMEMEED